MRLAALFINTFIVAGMCPTITLAGSEIATPSEARFVGQELQPRLCLGATLHEDTVTWGAPQSRLPHCPEHYAATSVSVPVGKVTTPKDVFAYLDCCPLPGTDILLDSHFYSTDSCGSKAIATGLNYQNGSYVLRCTNINIKRYKLSPPTPGYYWGFGALYWKNNNRIMWRDIPLALRYSAGRSGRFAWRTHGCIGFPFGSLLTGKSTKRCRGFTFRQLLFAGMNEDETSGSPVKIIANCSRISDPLNENAECLK